MARAERSLFRHLIAYQAGQHDEDHMAAVVFNACVILDHEERIGTGELPPRLDDRDEHRQTARPLPRPEAIAVYPINECRFCMAGDKEPDDHHPIGLM
jgi:hypothetical protein